jgi:hypothetical protein
VQQATGHSAETKSHPITTTNLLPRAIEIHSTPSFRWEVKPEVPYSKILRHVKNLLTYQRYWIHEILIPSSIPPTRSRCLLVGLPETSGRWVRSYPQLASSSSPPWLPHSHSLGGWTIGQWWLQFWDISLTPHNQSISINFYSFFSVKVIHLKTIILLSPIECT